eukprot:gene22979-43400_t
MTFQNTPTTRRHALATAAALTLGAMQPAYALFGVGDIVLDRSAFSLPEVDPAQFAGEPLRPYNATPDALLINFKSVVMTFTPDRAAQ